MWTGEIIIYLNTLGFNSGSIYWDDEDTSTDNAHGGALPDGSYNDDTRIDYCCRYYK